MVNKRVQNAVLGYNLKNNRMISVHFQGQLTVAQMVKHLPTMWKTWVQSLGWEDLLEKEMATHSSILALRTP